MNSENVTPESRKLNIFLKKNQNHNFPLFGGNGGAWRVRGNIDGKIFFLFIINFTAMKYCEKISLEIKKSSTINPMFYPFHIVRIFFLH